jgi:hypothetical protein
MTPKAVYATSAKDFMNGGAAQLRWYFTPKVKAIQLNLK